LTGVTEGLARAIVAYRQKHGDFKSPEDLELVEGIRYDTVNINRNVIVVK
jgi:competence ComEA-like helix-hairpin-helix protein